MYIIVHEPTGPIVFTKEHAWESFLTGKMIIEAAGGMVFNPKGDLLMMLRRGQWDMPKGKLDEGETIEACAVREVQEETGISTLRLCGKLQTTYHTYSFQGKTILKPSHWFKMESTGSEDLVPQTEEDITELRWVDKSEAAALAKKAFPSISEMVEKYYL
jgi:8-oxo-dGTP pyrophosphatase MutT (NUDIX family)